MTPSEIDDMILTRAVLASVIGSVAFTAAAAQEYPTPVEGEWVARDFRMHSGEVVPELRLHYRTIGDPSGEPVLVLHGTGGSGSDLLTESFAGELFGPGQPLDATRFFIILPDAIGHGRSSKPSDGLRMRFPRYNSQDMVHAQYLLIREHFGLDGLHLVLGNSMGGMHTWLWGGLYPDFMKALVPLASLPVEMSGRNWMTRRMLIEMVRSDPDWNGGEYTTQPRVMRAALLFFSIATSGGTLRLHRAAPTREAADRLVDQRLEQTRQVDANDMLYAWDSSRDYDPSPLLDRIEAKLLAINAADDERNPPELGVMEQQMPRVRNGRYVLIPASENTAGHGTTTSARWWKHHLAELLDSVAHPSP